MLLEDDDLGGDVWWTWLLCPRDVMLLRWSSPSFGRSSLV